MNKIKKYSNKAIKNHKAFKKKKKVKKIIFN